MHGMDLSFNKHFHSLNKTVFAVGKKRSSVLPDKSSCPVYITGSCGNTENIGFRNYQYLAFIVRRQQEKSRRTFTTGKGLLIYLIRIM